MIQFWQENSGENSATRLVFLVGSLWLKVITTYMLISGKASISEAAIFFSTIFGLLAGTKLVQKHQEK